MLCNGHMNKILAYETGLTESTIKAHISSILRKFDVPNRTQAILDVINPYQNGGI
jgi:DNA-binding NarL/FixJ family response regulator